MKILIVAPFHTGSHKSWTGLFIEQFPSTKIISLSGVHWKWRMEGGAIALAEQFKTLTYKPDLIIGTSMLNLPLFYAHADINKKDIPCITFFHENQFAYPKSEHDQDEALKREAHYAFIQLSSALFANWNVFNSEYNRSSFIQGIEKLNRFLPDHKPGCFDIDKSSVIYPVFHFPKFESEKIPNTILWNHRWEFDKNPEGFLWLIRQLKAQGKSFKLIVLGPGTEKPAVQKIFHEEFANETLHVGFAESKAAYYEWMAKASILPVTSYHDFYGVSVAEAIYNGAFPILPNRMAYPELVETSNLYDSEEELLAKTIQALETPKDYSPKIPLGTKGEFEAVFSKIS